MHSRATADDAEHINVLFEDVRAVKLRAAYRPLILHTAGSPDRLEPLEFAEIPVRFRPGRICLTLPTSQDGFIVGAKAAVLALARSDDEPDRGWENATPTRIICPAAT